MEAKGEEEAGHFLASCEALWLLPADGLLRASLPDLRGSCKVQNLLAATPALAKMVRMNQLSRETRLLAPKGCQSIGLRTLEPFCHLNFLAISPSVAVR